MIAQFFQNGLGVPVLFKNSTELGRIYNLIPWDDLVKLLPEKKSPAGAPSYLPRAGYFGLMFLKHYTGLSDEKLLAALQTNFAYQMFCGCRLKVGQVIRDNAFVSRTRSYLAKYCDMNKVQKVLIEAWKGKLENTNVLMMEAPAMELMLRSPFTFSNGCQTTLGIMYFSLGRANS